MSLDTLPTHIAWRYLWAPKSHSAVSAIAITSVVGVAVATAAIVCVLSVFNGFRGLLNHSLDTLSPDVMVTPSSGKTFSEPDLIIGRINKIDGVETAMPSVSDNALAFSNGREMPVTIHGVEPKTFARITAVDSIIIDGTPPSRFATRDAAIAIGIARQLAATSASGEHLFIFAPKREGRVNLANPMTSFVTDSVQVAAIFQTMQSEYDENTIICDIGIARDLFQYTTQATAVEVMAKPGMSPQKLADKIRLQLGDIAIVKDRIQQQEMNFRMVSIEKWVTFLLTVFILMIASFNIISTLCMLILEKQQSMATLSSLGMRRKSIGRIFWWESIYVSLLGGFSGIAAGLLLCLVQQHLGLIKLSGDPESMLVTTYPVAVAWTDILIAIAPVIIIGLFTACISSAFAKSRIELPK